MLGGLAACYRADPCVHTDACPEGTVCQPDGRCTPLETDGLRFAATHSIAVTGWATSRDDGSPAPRAVGDTMVIGGPRQRVAHLSFGPMPDAVRLERAVLVLQPHPAWQGATHPWRVGVHAGPGPDRVARRDRDFGREYRPARSVVRIRTGMHRPLIIDVTSLVTEALEAGDESVSLAIRVLDRSAPAMRLASPRAADSRLHPRLALVVR